MNDRTKGLLYINLAAFLAGGTPLFAKVISLPIPTIIFIRCVVASVILGGITLLMKESLLPNSKRDAVNLLILGGIMGIHWWAYFASIQISTVAIGVITFFTYPVLVVILEPFLFREKLHLRDLLLALVLFFGVLLMIPEWSFENELTWGIIIGLLSALTFAIRNIGMRKWARNYSGNRTMFFQVVVIALLFLPAADFSPEIWSWKDFIYLVVLGIFFTAGVHTLIVASIRYLKVKTVGIVGSSQSFYAIIFAFLVLGEVPRWQTFLGGLIILSCGLFEVFARYEGK